MHMLNGCSNKKPKMFASSLVTFLSIAVVLCLTWSVCHSEGQPGGPASTAPFQSLEDRWGIKALSIRPTAEGFFIDFRYRVIDAEKAAPVFSPAIKPILIDEDTGAVMAVPTVPKVGSMRSTRKPVSGRGYAILFANPNNHVKPGHRVTVVIGDYRAEHLVVEGEGPGALSVKPGGANEDEKNVTESGKPIRVRKGQQFKIILESNPTTGYRWDLAQPVDEGRVRFMRNEYKARESDRIGGGGREIWTFTALETGTAKITMKYARPWEKDAREAESVAFDVIVQ